MKIHNALSLLTILFSHFSSYNMDMIPDCRPLPKKYFLKTDDQMSEPVGFAIEIPQEISHYFVPREEKLKMTPEAFTRITTISKEEKRKKDELALRSQENIQLKQKKLELDIQNAELEKKIAQVERELQQRKEYLEKKRQAELKEKEIDDKIFQMLQMQLSQKDKKITAEIAASQKSKTLLPITFKDRRFALCTLMKIHEVDSQNDLFDDLYDICDGLSDDLSENNFLEGPYFDAVNHVLFGTIDNKYTYTYYPCTGKISIHRASFAELFKNITSYLKEGIVCSKDCTYYHSKKNLSCQDAKSHSSHSSDMDTSSDGELEIVETT